LLRFSIDLTKEFHIEQLRIALLNHILAKQTKQDLLIRLDDSGNEKNIDEREVSETLALFGIDYTRIVAVSENIKYHTGMGMKLLLDKKAFNCFCSDEALETDKQKAKEKGEPYSYSGFCETISDETKFQCNAPFVVRIKKPDHNIQFTDLLKGELEYNPNKVDSFVILTHDKTPTDNFASAVDDMLYDISTVIKEENEVDNTPKQIHVRETLGYDKQINYIHLPMIEYKETPQSVKELVDMGYLPIAIANYLIFLGYKTPCEIFTIEEALQWFELSNISQESPLFDLEKLNHINREYMKTLDNIRFSKIVGFADEDIGKLAKLYIKECNTTKEIKEKIDTIFSKKTPLDEFQKEYEMIQKCLENAPFIKEFEEFKKYITEKTGLSDEKLFVALNFILTGTTNTKNLKLIYPLIRNYLGEII
jgi:glutamyl-tRNA synthetase